MHTIFFLIVGISYIAFNDAASLSLNEQKITLRGRVVFPDGPRTPIESDGVLTVELQDTSLMDVSARVIARGTGKAIRFPMAFAVKYFSKEISPGNTYSLRVTIRNKKNELLYINDVHIAVTPIGTERTKFIDVPVILVKKSTPKLNRQQWPELVGKTGQEAVQTIKQETGFKNVMTINEGSVITMDFCSNRVRVFVNKKGIVSRTPTIA
ncbi:hypothetical protein I4U23_012712 [Adineta vaga]|nr:hypothetical protein I4U23_012712 [Adineta vaga]